MSRQVETERITWAEMVASADFADGYLAAAKGQHFDDWAKTHGRAQWLYERGRLVAIESRRRHGRPLRLWIDTAYGQAVNPQVISLACSMHIAGELP